MEAGMKRKRVSILLVLAIFAAFAVPLAAQTTYDRAVVVQVMRDNATTLGQVRSALNRDDFFAAAAGFWKFAEGQNRIMQYTPPKGSKAEWDKVLDQFVSTALRGVGAAGEKDRAKGLAVLAELQRLNQSGHAMFR
jgi:parvulin-like peptidyl-prolyl isomerase